MKKKSSKRVHKGKGTSFSSQSDQLTGVKNTGMMNTHDLERFDRMSDLDDEIDDNAKSKSQTKISGA